MFRISTTGVASVTGFIAISLNLEQKAVFTDKTVNLYLDDIKADMVQRFHADEFFGNVLDLENFLSCGR
jgi:hypothetical protein